jgi:hypothetical protein
VARNAKFEDRLFLDLNFEHITTFARLWIITALKLEAISKISQEDNCTCEL